MADPINSSDVFKFVTLRAPILIEKPKEQNHFMRDPRPVEITPLGSIVAKYGRDGAQRVPVLAKELAGRSGYTPSYPDDDPFFTRLGAVIGRLAADYKPATF